MTQHRWSHEDYVTLIKNVQKFGQREGCKRTSEQLYVSMSSAKSMYWQLMTKKPELVDEVMNSTLYSDNSEKRKYTRPENEYEVAEFLKKEVQKSPNNLSVAFRRTAEEFGMSISSICMRWYGCKIVTKNRGKEYVTDYSTYPSCKKNIEPIFQVISMKSATVNGKNQQKPTTKRIPWFFAMLFNIKKKNK